MKTSTGTGLSGSTAWNASVRSRLYFKRATTDGDEEPDPDLRVGDEVKFRPGRRNNKFALEERTIPARQRCNDSGKDGGAAEDMFLALLAEFGRQGRNASAKPNALTYAPSLFVSL
jgi:hypothetical protein